MTIPARRPSLAPLAASLFLASFDVGAALAPDVLPVIDDYGEIHEHLIGEYPHVTTAWFDTTTDRDSPGWQFDLVIDENGLVKSARLEEGSPDYRHQAQLVAEATRFKPFVRDGKPTTVAMKLDIWSQPADYAGPVDRNFPANADPSTVVIALARSQCLGTCPDYRVEIRGDGEVRYEGHRHVVIPGTLHWRVDPALIAPLLDRFRNADYFKLAGSYQAPMTDLPGYTTRLSLGERHKIVFDYGGGGGFGEAMASTQMPGEWPDMPVAVTEIEDAIDAVSGVKSFVAGDGTTLEKLRAKHWNFRSPDAGNAVRKLLSDCKTGVARGFIDAGAPVDNAGDGGFGGGMPIAYAVHCADVDLVRVMLDKGALKKPADTKEFLWSSVASGDPRMVALALTRNMQVNEKGEDGTPLLSRATGSYVREDNAPNAAMFDSAKVVEMLIDAGADPNARDGDGRTPIFEANEATVAAALLRRGADPNARDKRGRTAIEQMNSRSVIAALLAAGAKLPSDPARRQAMIAKATQEEWTELLPLLTSKKP